jgi:hypothetical protein
MTLPARSSAVAVPFVSVRENDQPAGKADWYALFKA